jgi:hypothetical protein
MADYDKAKWFQLYARAMLEVEHASIAGRIMDARGEILRRLKALKNLPGLHGPERLSIKDALSNLYGLEREEARYADEKRKEAAKLALGRLRSMGPIMERLNASNVPDQS